MKSPQDFHSLVAVIESLQYAAGMERQAVTRRGQKPPIGEPVVDRAFALLGAFNQTRHSLSLTELSQLTNQPVSTALRLATKLLEQGALERRDDGRFIIGLRMWEIGALAPRGMGLRQFALPRMTDLVEATHENVLLVVPDGNHGLVIERLAGSNAVTMEFAVRGYMPLHLTSSGLVLLAHADAALREEVLGGPLPMRPMTDRGSPTELRSRMANIRRDGFCVLRSNKMPVSSVAAPIWNSRQQVVAAISVVAHKEGFEPAALVPLVRNAARDISIDLQAHG